MSNTKSCKSNFALLMLLALLTYVIYDTRLNGSFERKFAFSTLKRVSHKILILLTSLTNAFLLLFPTSFTNKRLGDCKIPEKMEGLQLRSAGCHLHREKRGFAEATVRCQVRPDRQLVRWPYCAPVRQQRSTDHRSSAGQSCQRLNALLR